MTLQTKWWCFNHVITSGRLQFFFNYSSPLLSKGLFSSRRRRGWIVEGCVQLFHEKHISMHINTPKNFLKVATSQTPLLSTAWKESSPKSDKSHSKSGSGERRGEQTPEKQGVGWGPVLLSLLPFSLAGKGRHIQTLLFFVGKLIPHSQNYSWSVRLHGSFGFRKQHFLRNSTPKTPKLINLQHQPGNISFSSLSGIVISSEFI